jgi:hypothetical protein
MRYRSLEPKQMDYLCGKMPGFGLPVDLSFFMVFCMVSGPGMWTSKIAITHVSTLCSRGIDRIPYHFQIAQSTKSILGAIVMIRDSPQICSKAVICLFRGGSTSRFIQGGS